MNSKKQKTTKNNTSYFLEDCHKVKLAHPNTNQCPTDSEITSLKVGDLVKLVFNQVTNEDGTLVERMWVKIKTINEDGSYSGILDFNPLVIGELKRGCEITFRKENIAIIY
ncbi:hypothetical protein [Mucilaginibacter sp. CSA2-8R]|uniref:hypothetical protein n=1 Tax=Mucilaginibacter sp. CSA2-8R TaxID=3141542 RepID=UPI00315D459D